SSTQVPSGLFELVPNATKAISSSLTPGTPLSGTKVSRSPPADEPPSPASVVPVDPPSAAAVVSGEEPEPDPLALPSSSAFPQAAARTVRAINAAAARAQRSTRLCMEPPRVGTRGKVATPCGQVNAGV